MESNIALNVSTREPCEATTAHPRVLLVDDDRLVREHLRTLVAAAGFPCDTADGGATALQVLHHHFCPIVITDRLMPEMDGLDLCRALRGEKFTESLHIVMLTVCDSTEDVIAGLEAGADDYLSKRAGRSELLARLHAARCRLKLAQALRCSEQHYRELAKTLEDRVEERTSELHAMFEELESLSYTVSHDLRAPLRHISAYAHLLLERPVVAADPAARREAAVIAAAASSMGRMIEEILADGRQRHAPMSEEIVDMGALVDEVRTELILLTGARLIRWKVAALPPVRGDRAMLRRVWSNLLGNAVKYTSPRPEACIEVGCERGEQRLSFFVRDNGVGFDPESAARLFTLFQRLHPVSDFEGTGVGLASVRRLVARHEGRTWAEAESGSGATFWFDLPTKS